MSWICLFNGIKVKTLCYCRPYCFQYMQYSSKFVAQKPKTINRKTVIGTVNVWKGMTLIDLSQAMNLPISQIKAAFMECCPDAKALIFKKSSKVPDVDLLISVARICGFKPITGSPPNRNQEKTVETGPQLRTEFDKSLLQPRPPVITIMGHVDHGKTSLLDALRKSRVVSQEHGGITQHIGAFSVPLSSSLLNRSSKVINGIDQITFLDTPGHAAFAAMRSRGARCTDLVILVVAADDGIMPQTVESIRYAREANVPILVAINKIDKGITDFTPIKEVLASHGVVVEEYGGDTQVVPISALKNINLDKLLEAILVQVEIMQIRADPTGMVQGVIVESRTLHGRGKVATVLVQHGTLELGDFLVAGSVWCRVRNLFDDFDRPLTQVKPGGFAEVTGWRELPSAGEIVLQAASEHEANAYTSKILERIMTERSLECHKNHLENMAVFRQKRKVYHEKVREALLANLRRNSVSKPDFVDENNECAGQPRLSVIIKGDTDGTLEAVLNILDSYESDQCHLDIAHFGVGPLAQADILVAETCLSMKTADGANWSTIIYLYNVTASAELSKMALQKNIHVKEFNVIYHLADDVRAELQSLLPPLYYTETIGEAVIQEIFTITENRKKVTVLGCRCLKGNLNKMHKFKVMRPNAEHSNNEDELDELRRGVTLAEDLQCRSLKQFRNDVDTIFKDTECGIQFQVSSEQEDWLLSVKPGDIVFCYETKSRTQPLDWEVGF